MKTKEDIESYLLKAGLPYQEVKEGTWVVGGDDDAHKIVLRLEPPVLEASSCSTCRASGRVRASIFN